MDSRLRGNDLRKLKRLIVAMLHVKPPHRQSDKRAENDRDRVDGKVREDHAGINGVERADAQILVEILHGDRMARAH